MTLYVIVPQAVTDATLSAASMAEDNLTSAWAPGTTYQVGDRCHSTTTHRVYEARAITVDANPAIPANQYDDDETAQAPKPNPNGPWIDAGATNRWRAFDGQIGTTGAGLPPLVCSDTADLDFTIVPSGLVNSVALLNVTGASVRVSVGGEPITDATLIGDDSLLGSGGIFVYDQEVALVDNSNVEDFYWDWFYAPVRAKNIAIFQGVSGFTGLPLRIQVKAASGTRSVGEIVLGREEQVGQLLVGADTDINDLTRFDTDDFGNETVIRRAYADRTTFPLALRADEVADAKRRLAALRGVPSVYHAGAGLEGLGLTTYGTFRRLPFSQPAGPMAFLNLEVQGRI